MKTKKNVFWAIAVGLLLFMPYVIRRHAATDVNDAVSIKDDSLSYAVSMIVASDMPLAIKEFGITPETLEYFVKGVTDAFPADASPEAIAYAHGVIVGASAMDMLDEADRAISLSDTTKKVDKHIFLQGLRAMAYGNNDVMTLEAAYDYYYKTVFRVPSEEFIARNASRNGVESLPCGVQIKIERPGTGVTASLGSTVSYIYKASFINGKVAESSRGEAVEAVVGGMQPGLAAVFTTLPVGTKCKAYIPWQLAYGARGANRVPPYSALVYDIEIVGIVK